MSRIVLATCGSLGDLLPYLAVGLGMRERGHQVVLATNESHRARVESSGLAFHAVRPDCDWLFDPERVRRFSHPRLGLLRVGREWLLPALRDSYEDTRAAVEGADLLVSMVAAYAARLVAETTGMPWASALHIPMGFFSAHDLPTLDIAPGLSRRLRCLGPSFWRPLLWCGKRATRSLARPWYRLRRELGLPPTSEGNPLADGHSPQLSLALFSNVFAKQQPDWPASTVVTGFPFPDRQADEELPPPLAEFLAEGSPPIVFTLGSAVSGNAGSFYEDSARCAEQLGHRAVLVLGRGGPGHRISSRGDVFSTDYAPFSELFRRAALVVHHGGIGTTALALRAGCPMLVVSQAWDQLDNGDRAARLGAARRISRSRYTADRAAREIRRMIEDSSHSERARQVREELREEEGVRVACDALEGLLQGR